MAAPRPIAYLSRTEEFSSSHRLHSALLSAEANAELYGKCNHPNGHGHNYRIVVTLRGEVNAATGMVMNISDLKAAMQVAILDPLDHRNLDQDVPFFHNHVSTTENVCIFAWTELARVLPDPSLLYEVCIHETSKNAVIYRGGA